MADAPITLPVSFEGFLAAEQGAPMRHEWVAGAVYAMAGGTERHDVAVNVLTDLLRPGARAAGCRTFSGNRLLHAGDVAYYPDLFVVCGPPAHLLYETDATLVVEVRSNTTAGRDRREKALAYASLPSLRCYLLVDPDRPAVECGVRSDRFFSWTAAEPGDFVPTPYGPLVVDELYRAIDEEAFTPPPGPAHRYGPGSLRA